SPCTPTPHPPNPTLFPYTTLFRSTKPIPKKDPNMRTASTETLSEPRHPTGFHQYCTSCGREQLFSVDTLGWKTCTVCRRTAPDRSEEHTSELQSRFDLVCRLLLEK